MECITEGCTGTVSFAALQQGPLKHPLEVNVLVHPEEKKKKQGSESKPKGQAPKAEKDDKAKGSGKEGKDSAGAFLHLQDAPFLNSAAVINYFFQLRRQD